ncbi:Long-chain-fatty-acid--CoA ligase FadD13 [Alphaproteobacteria bacterium SO-S41]|nr:Long-chain-fatty-acid--CoA ligase FadD13 [Alphaproteobacteria bacterium SO-S41]
MSHPSIFAQSTPDKIAFVMAGSGEQMTYAELNARSNQGAQLFRALGLKTGDAIAVFMENNVHYLPLCWAAQRSGLYFTCISSRLTAGEVEYIVKDSGARALITSAYLAKTAAEVAPLIPGVKLYMANGATAPFESIEAALDAQPTTPIADQMSGADLLYSSGTTGRPKGVKSALSGLEITDPGTLMTVTRGLFGFSEDMIYLSPAPLYHAAPLRYCMSVGRFGGSVVVMEHFDPEQYLALIEKYKVTHSQLVPTMFVRMLKMPAEARTKYDLSSLKVAIHAAAPCPVDVKHKMIDWWGPIIHEYYAGTEGNGFVYTNSADWLAHPGTVGRAVLGIPHIVGEDGNEVAVGEEGVIYFEGGPEFQYHNAPEKTAESKNAKGWSTLGDVGKLDADGFLYLTDRKAFMIISGGVNIYPQETENVLIGHAKVQDVAVVGIPNEDFGEEVKAVVQPIDWADANDDFAAELMAYARQHLSAIKCPRSIDFMAELPRHPTGKLYKRLIRDAYWGKKDSKIV